MLVAIGFLRINTTLPSFPVRWYLGTRHHIVEHLKQELTGHPPGIFGHPVCHPVQALWLAWVQGVNITIQLPQGYGLHPVMGFIQSLAVRFDRTASGTPRNSSSVEFWRISSLIYVVSNLVPKKASITGFFLAASRSCQLYHCICIIRIYKRWLE